jgi:hypothetical protein
LPRMEVWLVCMKNSSRNRTIKLSSLLLVLACAPASLAQSDPNRAATILSRVKAVNETERERDLRSIPKVPPVSDKELQKLRASLMKQLGDDFRSLQLVDNEMMSEAVASKVLNCEHLTRQLAQIKARAGSLKTNLALPDTPVPAAASKKDQPDTISDQFVRTQLDSLDKSIQDFVKNPIFRDPNVLDVKLSLQASQSLKTILELSEDVKRNASKLARLHKPQR